MLMMTVWFVGIAQGQPFPRLAVYIDGELMPTEVDPVIRLDRAMVPLRAVGESLGMQVLWDAHNHFVLLSSPGRPLVLSPGVTGSPESTIRLFLDGQELPTEEPPFIHENRTMVPLRVISEGLGMNVEWNPERYEVRITSKPAPSPTGPEVSEPVLPPATPEVDEPAPTPLPIPEPVIGLDYEAAILGEAQVSADQLRSMLGENNPDAPDLVDLYLNMGREYGVRGDLAFCQAAKETGWWRFTGIVQPWQNNYCGLGATGAAATGDEDLLGADSSRIRYEASVHGAIFAAPEDGVEAQIQHLYAYACKNPLPAGKTLVDPRFAKVTRGCAPRWIDLGGRWAYPGYDRNIYPGENGFQDAFANQDTYGHSIIKNYYAKMF